MQLSHRSAGLSATFEETNLVSAAGLVPAMAVAMKTGLGELTDQRLSLPGYYGANAGLKVTALVAGMVAGADSIDDMAILRHGGMKKLFTGAYAPSTLGSFLRTFTFGHVRQLDAIASRWLTNLATAAPIAAGIDDYALVDIDDTIKEVHGYQKQGAGYGYSGVRGLNALIGIVSTKTSAPVIIGSRLRKGATGSPRGRGNSSPMFLRRSVGCVPRPRPGWCCCAPTARSMARRSSQRPTGPGRKYRSPPGWTRLSNAPSPPSPTIPGQRFSTPTRSGMRPPGNGSLPPKSLR